MSLDDLALDALEKELEEVEAGHTADGYPCVHVNYALLTKLEFALVTLREENTRLKDALARLTQAAKPVTDEPNQDWDWMTLADLVRWLFPNLTQVVDAWRQAGKRLPQPCRCMTRAYPHVDPACSLHGHEVRWD